ASVNGAVRVFPFPSRQRASFSPLRVMISALPGNGLVNDFLKTEPMSLPSWVDKPQSEVGGEPVGHVEPDRLVPPDEPHDAGAGNPRFPRQGLVACAAVDDGSPENVSDRRCRLALAHSE